MQNKNGNSAYDYRDADTAYNSQINAMTDSIHCTIPVKAIVCSTKDHNPWLTKRILKSINQKNKLCKCYIKNPSIKYKERFSQFRNKLTHIIRKSKRDRYTGRINSTQGDSKKTWQVLNEVLGRGRKGTVLPDTNGNTSKDINDLTNSFNNHFVSLGENLASKITQPQGTSYRQHLHGNYSKSFFLRPTDCDKVHKIIKNMKSSHTAGADEICSTILKAIVSIILEPLVYCINLSLLSGKVPKIARILPIYKSGDKNDINS